MTHTNTNAIPMTKPFSTNPKLADWVPSEQQIQTITAARELWDLVPEEEGDDLNLFKINALDVRCHLHPEVTAPQQLLDDTLDFIRELVVDSMAGVPEERSRTDGETDHSTTLPPHLRSLGSRWRQSPHHLPMDGSG